MLNNLFKRIGMMFFLAGLMAGVAFAQASFFTYQGRLTDAGNPANGGYDMQFKLFDVNGIQQGSPFSISSVQVTNGVFKVDLDFGSAVFDGSRRFLEIGVRPESSTDPHTVLSPRQLLTATPYSIRSLVAGSADTATNAVQLAGLAASQYLLTTGNGSGLTSLNASNISSGTLANTRGGTGLNVSGASGNVLRSNGTTWTSSPVQSSDLPDDFNISGTGTASFFNATTHYNIGGNRVLSNAGSSNIFAGASAGFNNTSGNANSFFGALAGFANQTGNRNSFFGVNAGLNNTASDNSFFGRLAGFTNQTGSSNSFFGSDAGFSNTAGFNSFFGASAGQANSTGTQNSFFGYNAGLSNTTDGANSFFGYKAGEQNTAGFNSFFGANTGQANTNGTNNAFFGNEAGLANTFGSENSFFGRNAGGANTTGGSNSFFGTFAGRDNNGSQNSFFGVSAGVLNSTGTGNTFVGDRAGIANTSGTNNTTLGTEAAVASANLNNAAAVGAFASVSQSNSLVLGSINNVNGATADTKVGIGTTAPVATLNVVTSSSNAADNTATFKATNIGPNQSHIHFGTAGNWFIRSAAGTGKVILQDTGGNVGDRLAKRQCKTTGGWWEHLYHSAEQLNHNVAQWHVLVCYGQQQRSFVHQFNGMPLINWVCPSPPNLCCLRFD